MDNVLKTVGAEPEDNDISLLVDPLTAKQKAHTDEMRSALLSCNFGDITSTKATMQYITLRRVIHQIERIIKYTEMMDRLEDKLYASIDANLAQMDEFDPTTMTLLAKMQETLQENMIASQKLLQPYLEMDISAYMPAQSEDTQNSFMANIIPQASRTTIRNGAQALLTELKKRDAALVNDESIDIEDDCLNGTVASGD
jgi:hypothetical protein